MLVGDTEGPDPQALVDALGASHAQTILNTIDEPMSVKEISHLADVPLSSTYRRVNALVEAGLLDTRVAIDPEEGRHVTQYVRGFDTIEMSMTDDGVAVRVID